MEGGLSKERARRLKQAREAFHSTGKSVASFAREHGFSAKLVYMVLSGRRTCLRGQSHRIAVKLGIKDGVVED